MHSHPHCGSIRELPAHVPNAEVFPEGSSVIRADTPVSFAVKMRPGVNTELARRMASDSLAGGPGFSFGVEIDERLREKEFGVMGGLTKRGIRERLPELDARRRKEGKFYYRPPGGESWCDVVLRLRSFWTSLALERSGPPRLFPVLGCSR
jgi:hypothetical protein